MSQHDRNGSTGRDLAGALKAKFGLTDKQGRVAHLMLRGVPIRAIARELECSEGAVKDCRLVIYRKTDCHSEARLVEAAYEAWIERYLAALVNDLRRQPVH